MPHATAETAESTGDDRPRLSGQTAFGTRLPGVCLLPRRAHGPRSRRERCMNRLDATRQLIAALADEPVVASLGHPAYDLFAAGDRPANFYTWGSMGLASSIGLGLALARPDLRVFVLDGDGSLLMNLGSLATIGWTRPENLVLIVWDNEEYGTTGGQPTATAHGADLAAAGDGPWGLPRARPSGTRRSSDAAIARARTERGPWMIVAKVRGIPADGANRRSTACSSSSDSCARSVRRRTPPDRNEPSWRG